MRGNCPRCANPLSERGFGTVTLDGCASCGGLWFDHHELTQLTRDPSVGLMEVERAFQQAITGSGAGGDMQCPRCAVPLVPFSFNHTPGIQLDACRQCKGIWVDDGELQAISERIMSQNAAASKPAPALPRDQARTVTAFLLSAPCSSCRTTNPAASLVCWACGKALKTRSVLRLCPRCDRPLDERRCSSGPVTVDACLSCSGVWFDAGELPVFYQLGVESVQEVQGMFLQRACPPQTQAARCPCCHYTMQREKFGAGRTVEVDMCDNCKGMWMDAGELMAAYDLMNSGDFLRADAAADSMWARD